MLCYTEHPLSRTFALPEGPYLVAVPVRHAFTRHNFKLVTGGHVAISGLEIVAGGTWPLTYVAVILCPAPRADMLARPRITEEAVFDAIDVVVALAVEGEVRASCWVWQTHIIADNDL